MASLPSPPLSPVTHPYNTSKTACSPKIGHRKSHRHPDRRRDTYEILQVLMTEHQRLEQLEYENMLREVPFISCSSTDNVPKGILVNKNHPTSSQLYRNNNNNNNNNNIPATTTTTLTPTTVSSVTLPPQLPHDNHHHGSTTKLVSNISLSSSHQSVSSTSTSSISTSSSHNSNNSSSTRQSVRFAPGPPKVYSYPKLQLQH